MGFFRKKKAKQLNIELSSGLFLKSIPQITPQSRFFSSAPKGILSFLIVFGSIGGFMSAFNMSVYYLIAAAVLFLCAMYFSYAYSFKNERKKDLYYVIFFICYVFGIYIFKAYVNSGFAAIVNIVRQRAEVYFDLNPSNQFAEKIDDRYLSLTITFIFIGMFAILVLNIFISNYMSLLFAILSSLPIYVFPLYLQNEPKLIFALFMFIGYAGIHVFRNNGHFKEGKNHLAFEQDKGKVPSVSYVQNNKVYLGVLMATIGCAILVALFASIYTQENHRLRYKENQYKDATRPGVSSFVMYGLYSFMHSPYSEGGMSGGKLKYFGGLRPSDETHLKVRFAPYDSSPIYMKAFTGIYYDDSTWFDGYYLFGSKRGESPYFYNENLYREAKQIKKAYKSNPEKYGKGKMDITNVGADTSYVYYPYFTKFDYDGKDVSKMRRDSIGIARNSTKTYTYYTNTGYTADTEDMISYVYKDVPKASEAAIDDVIHKMGLSLFKDYSNDPTVINTVVSYLKKEYSYSYNPGQVPKEDDFVTYFLEDNKKGVCMHFATAATLIFRRLGLPANYVEGYAFGYSAVLNGKVRKDLNYEDYYNGYSTIGKTAVVEVDVKDSDAHAWVEVYQKGKGWMIADPTPSSMDNENGTDFWKAINNFWNNSPDLSIGDGLSFKGINIFSAKGIKIAVGVLVGLFFFLMFLRVITIRIMAYMKWHTKDLKHNLIFRYSQLCEIKSKDDSDFARISVPSEQIKYLCEKKEEKKHDGQLNSKDLTVIFEQICFGNTSVEKDTVQNVMKQIRELFK